MENVQRPKSWKELTDTEKIERCREEIKSTRERLRRDLNKVDNIVRALLEHRHLPSGEVVKSIKSYDYSDGDCEKVTGGGIGGEVYF